MIDLQYGKLLNQGVIYRKKGCSVALINGDTSTKNIENGTLYHATYAQYVSSIFEHGLGEFLLDGKAGIQKNYPDSAPGVIYLANAPEIAESYAEAAIDDENTHLPASWINEIVIIEIDVNLINMNSLFPDRNVIDGTDTFEYHGTIPTAALRLHEKYWNYHYSI